MENKFYFTFGTDPQFPHYGGWVEVHAEDLPQAIKKFQAKYPDQAPGFVNCAFWYTEEQFNATKMAESGNFHNRCHEVIR